MDAPTTPRDDAAAPRRGGRWRDAWVLLPLAAALVYAGVRSTTAATPSLPDLVPSETVLLRRWRTMAVYDRLETPTVVEGLGVPVAASQALGAECNLPGLPGLSRERTLVDVTLDPARRHDPRLLLLPVDDPDAVERAFHDPDLAERHARHVEVHGGFASVAWDRNAAKRPDGRGPWPKDRGEDYCLHAEWPAFVDSCLLPDRARQPEVLGVLMALGYDPASARADEKTGELAVDAGRVPLVRGAWRTVTVWGFADRVRAELVPSDTSRDLADALRAAVAEPTPPADLPAATSPKADARLRVRGAAGRRALVLALGYAGVLWSKEAAKGEFAALGLGAPGSLELLAEPSALPLPHWTVAIAGDAAAMPDFVALGLPRVEVGGRAALAEGAAPPCAPFGGRSPAGDLSRRAFAGAGRPGLELYGMGFGGDELADRLARSAPDAALSAWPAPPPADEPGAKSVLLASFRLSRAAAMRLLGRAIRSTGFLSPLEGSDVEGTLSTDGVRLVLEARKAGS